MDKSVSVSLGTVIRRISEKDALQLICVGAKPVLFVLDCGDDGDGNTGRLKDELNDAVVLESVKIMAQRNGSLCIPNRVVRQLSGRHVVFVNKHDDRLLLKQAPDMNNVTSYAVSNSDNITISAGVLAKIGGGTRFFVRLLKDDGDACFAEVTQCHN